MRYRLAYNPGKTVGSRTLFSAWPEEHSAPAVPYFMRDSCHIVDLSLSVGCVWQTSDAQCRGPTPYHVLPVGCIDFNMHYLQ